MITIASPNNLASHFRLKNEEVSFKGFGTIGEDPDPINARSRRESGLFYPPHISASAAARARR